MQNIYTTHTSLTHVISHLTTLLFITQYNLVSNRNHFSCVFLISGYILGLSAQLSPSSHIITFLHFIYWVAIRPVSAFLFHNSSFSYVTTTGTIRPAQFQISQSVGLSARLSPTISHIPHQHFNHFSYTCTIHIAIFMPQLTSHSINP